MDKQKRNCRFSLCSVPMHNGRPIMTRCEVYNKYMAKLLMFHREKWNCRKKHQSNIVWWPFSYNWSVSANGSEVQVRIKRKVIYLSAKPRVAHVKMKTFIFFNQLNMEYSPKPECFGKTVLCRNPGFRYQKPAHPSYSKFQRYRRLRASSIFT